MPGVADPLRQARRQLQDGGRRLRALRVLLGFRTVEAFAEHVRIEGLGPGTLRDIEAPRNKRLLWDYEATAIAEACGIHAAYFFVPIEHLGDVAAPPRRG